MDTYSALSVEKLLKKWMKNANLTQQKLAAQLKISQSLLSRQILGKEKMPLDRVQEIIAITDPPADEVADMLRLQTADYGKNRCLAELHDAINKIGQDNDLRRLLFVWREISKEDRTKINKIIEDTERAVSARGEQLEIDKIPPEVQEILDFLNDETTHPIIKQLFIAMMDNLMGSEKTWEGMPDELRQRIMAQEKKLINVAGGMDNVLRMFNIKSPKHSDADSNREGAKK